PGPRSCTLRLPGAFPDRKDATRERSYPAGDAGGQVAQGATPAGRPYDTERSRTRRAELATSGARRRRDGGHLLFHPVRPRPRAALAVPRRHEGARQEARVDDHAGRELTVEPRRAGAPIAGARTAPRLLRRPRRA